ncbi:MAG: tyrosine-type recombinase/integrase [Fibromonadaceae bacterium]|jgi:site-specific recombinase XerD|nr:tyrosine-type recombinase/integrase [Fibromonadaceae bacterium]
MSETKYLLPKQRNKSKGSEIWYGGIVKNDETKWISLNTTDKDVAMDWFAKMQASRYAPPPPKEEQAARLKLSEAIDTFMSDVDKVRRRAPKTVSNYQKHFNSFRKWCGLNGIVDISNINTQLCSKYAREEMGNLAGNSAKARIILFRSFFRWVSNNYDIAMRNPFNIISLPKSKPEPRKFWTVEECEKIIEAANSDECKCWFALMAFAGLRREEARLLKMENIERCKISLIGKGGKAATIPISTKLKEHLNIYLNIRGDEPGYLFPTLAKLSPSIERYIRAAATKAGVSNADTAHYHRFRHSFASNLLRLGRNIKAVQMLMRHENVTLTLNTYGHLLPSDLEKEVEL